MSDHELKDRAKQIIAKCPNSMLMTVDAEGFPHSRIMHTADVDDDFTIYFVTGRNMPKCQQIAAHPRVCVMWTIVGDTPETWQYVVIKGNARVTDEQSLRDRLWAEPLERYFPGGKTDPNYVVIVVKPASMLLMDRGEYPLPHVEF